MYAMQAYNKSCITGTVIFLKRKLSTYMKRMYPFILCKSESFPYVRVEQYCLRGGCSQNSNNGTNEFVPDGRGSETVCSLFSIVASLHGVEIDFILHYKAEAY